MLCAKHGREPLVRTPPVKGPRLEALLDERDHLRVQISLAEEIGVVEPAILEEARRRLVAVDLEIVRSWGRDA